MGIVALHDDILNEYPIEVKEKIKEALLILENAYGDTSTRNIREKGGFVLLVESERDFRVLDDYNLDPNTSTVEYCDIIKTEHTPWISTLFLAGDDFGIVCVMPIEFATENILKGGN